MNDPSSSFNKPWAVWWDRAQKEWLAIESMDLTSALCHALKQEGVVVREVMAPNRYQAIRIAFPERFRISKDPSAKPPEPLHSNPSAWQGMEGISIAPGSPRIH